MIHRPYSLLCVRHSERVMPGNTFRNTYSLIAAGVHVAHPDDTRAQEKKKLAGSSLFLLQEKEEREVKSAG